MAGAPRAGMVIGRDLGDWTPVRILHMDGAPHVQWCDLTSVPFEDPFFAQTVQRAMYQPFNRAFRPITTLAGLCERQDTVPGPDPDLFIFHFSRCGSTLISRMLTTLPRTRVVSEAEPIESILRLPLVYGMAADDEWLKILRATIQTLGGSRRDIDRYVVKFDPWHSVDIETVRRAFPGVPCLFVYRHPLEVFASHARSVGGRMLGGPVEMYLSGLTPTDLAAMSIEEFWIHALRRWSEAGLDASHGGVRLVEYEQLPEIVPDLAEEYLHLPERATWWDSMTRLANQNAKSPETAFVQDSATRRDGVPEPWRSLIARDLVPVHHALEVQRLRQAGGKEPPSSAEAPSDYWRGG